MGDIVAHVHFRASGQLHKWTDPQQIPDVTYARDPLWRAAKSLHIRYMEIAWLRDRGLSSVRYKNLPRCTDLKSAGSIPAASTISFFMIRSEDGPKLDGSQSLFRIHLSHYITACYA